MPESGWTDADRRELEERGVALAEAERQLALLRSPPPPARLLRPATLGDGIRRIAGAEEARLLARAEEAAAAGRLSKFVPASGAASRMFQAALSVLAANDRKRLRRGPLEAAAKAGDAVAAEVLALVEKLDRFGFFPELAAAMERSGISRTACNRDGDYAPILMHLLRPVGLAYGAQPKALITFHREKGGLRTALDQHLAEAGAYVRDREGRARVHFTILPEHRARFKKRLELGAARLTPECTLEASLSLQAPATDTLALDETGEVAREASGTLLFRPGGHGALLGNLAAAGGDVVLIKNIDNVLPERFLPHVAHWKRLLAGLALELESERAEHLAALRRADPPPEARLKAVAFLRGAFGLDVADEFANAGRTRELAELLDRPLRVCGMVANRGEPGGGPFWVAARDGQVTLQIVEGAEINRADPEQFEALKNSTHFNPVDLVTCLRNPAGEPYELARFADPATAFVSGKLHEGRLLRALEHPGLWNGAMAGWLTVFVEVPEDTFAPVKTVLDLLRPEHQPP